MKLSQEKTQKDKQLSQIKSIENELTNNIFEGKKGRRRKFYLSKKVTSLKEKIEQKITF